MNPTMFLAALLFSVLHLSHGTCNEALCASLVSKCLLMKSCECDMTDKANCSCCLTCQRCLSRLYTECCSCVGMCPDRKVDHSSPTSSTVELLADPIPELFAVLTDEVDPLIRWTTYTYPAHLDLLYFKPREADLHYGLEETYNVQIADDEEASAKNTHPLLNELPSKGMNCTVAYMAKCMSVRRCKDSCGSMGAARYRWFHHYGCCECIASTCLDFGKAEALCHKCPLPAEEQEEDSS